MTQESTIDAVAMVRRIRDEHGKLLEGKSPEEVVAFYHKRAQKFERMLEERRKAQAAVEAKTTTNPR